MGRDFTCPRCRTFIKYGVKVCPGCGATFGYTEDIAAENARNQPGKLTEPDIIQIKYLLTNNRKIEAVKLVRDITGCGLATAKDTVEQIEKLKIYSPMGEYSPAEEERLENRKLEKERPEKEMTEKEIPESGKLEKERPEKKNGWWEKVKGFWKKQ